MQFDVHSLTMTDHVILPVTCSENIAILNSTVYFRQSHSAWVHWICVKA